jgi:hypothetical protein
MSETISPDLQIKEVSSRRDLMDFIRVPWGIYRDDPNWVPPLISERKQAFSADHPYFEHARWKAWVAHVDGRPVGRISAQVDQLYLEHHDARTGFFGLIEAPPENRVFAALFETAENWLSAQGMTKVLGPFNLGINQEIGVLVEGFETPPFVMMGHARPYYGPALEKLGYSKARDVFSYEINHEQFAMPPVVRRLLERQSDKMTLRLMNRRDQQSELESVREIFNDAWSQNWGFVPFSEKEFAAVGKELLMVVPDDCILIAEVNGEPAAFCVLLPNINEAIADLNGRLLPFGWARLLWRLKVRFPNTARVPLMGVRTKYQNTRLGPALAFLVIQALYEPTKRRGVGQVEMSWILEDNQGMRNIIEQLGGVVTKRYRMYGKAIDAR